MMVRLVLLISLLIYHIISKNKLQRCWKRNRNSLIINIRNRAVKWDIKTSKIIISSNKTWAAMMFLQTKDLVASKRVNLNMRNSDPSRTTKMKSGN